MFDLPALRAAITAGQRVARIVIADFQGSSPREVGASMLVWHDGQSGTIGGGALEWQAIRRARSMLAHWGSRLDHEALGPALGQCCGGVVTLLTEVYHAGNLPGETEMIARAASDHGNTGNVMPLAVKRLLAVTRGQGVPPAPQLVQGWMVEPVARPNRHLWVWGAGHVGRALVDVLAPLPALSITWVDTALERFPQTAANVRALPVADPVRAIELAPPNAEHLILTYSHALDLELCHNLLRHGFAACGLIGSTTKWARFRHRLAALGHAPDVIALIDCPIGDPRLGKHPQAIAIGVAAKFLQAEHRALRQENAG